MIQEAVKTPAYVIKVEELSALNHLTADHPRPWHVEWVNRGTNQLLKPSSVEMLMRTLYRDVLSPSAVRLHRSAGLRVMFRTEKERAAFATAFAAARDREAASPHLVMAFFDDTEHAEQAVSEMKLAGLPEGSISLLWLASMFMDTQFGWCEGHSRFSVAGATAGGGIAGAMLGMALLAIPGVGAGAAAGAIASSAISSVAAVSGIIGATGGAIARMLTDHDVDGVAVTYYEQQVRRGKVFVSVDTRLAEGQRGPARLLLRRHGGRTVAVG